MIRFHKSARIQWVKFQMHKLFTFIGISFCLYTSLFGQSHDINIDSTSDSSQTVLIRIGGMTTGINKKRMGVKEVVFADNSAVIAERTKAGYYLMANANFHPTLSEMAWINGLKVAFLFLPIMDQDDPKQLDRYYPLPSWLRDANQIEFLVLNQVTLNDCNLFGEHLSFLILNKVQFEDKEKFLHELGKSGSLRYLVHDLALTPSEVKELKNSIPEINVMSFSEYEAAIRSGTIKQP